MNAKEKERYWMWWFFYAIVIGLPIVVGVWVFTNDIAGVIGFVIWLGFVFICLARMGDGREADKS